MSGSRAQPIMPRFRRLFDKGRLCWNWLGNKNRGYGIFNVYGKPVLAHRVAYRIANGPIPKGMFVCHACDNPSCVKPSHLWLGTHADNMRDMSMKGRRTSPGAKLEMGDVQKIRLALASGITQTFLAKQYKVTQVAISKIYCKRSWKMSRNEKV